MTRRAFIIIVALIALIGLAITATWSVTHKNDQLSFDNCVKTKDPTVMSACISQEVTKQLKKRNDRDAARYMLTVNKKAVSYSQEVAAICHIAMHKTGRDLAIRQKITLSNLINYMPKSDSPDCPAGFTHGILSIIAADVTDNKKLLATCAKQQSQGQQLSCIHGIGHSFRRTFFRDQTVREPIDGCRTLGRNYGDECAAGVYHDYMLALKGYDDTYKPKKYQDISRFCLNQPNYFLKQCWYRLFVVLGPPIAIDRPEVMGAVCGNLRGKQKSGCFAGLATRALKLENLVGWCSKLKKQDAGYCVSGGDLTAPDFLVEQKQKVDIYRRRRYIPLIAECSSMPSSADKRACGYWLAYRSVRESPGWVSPKQGVVVCSGGERMVVAACRQGIQAALNNRVS